MYDELTRDDIKKLQDELDYRTNKLRPDILDDIGKAKEYGDLSDNAEYREAKRAKGRNEGRIKYLKDMILTAKVITIKSKADEVGLMDKVEVLFEDDDTTMELEISTTVAQDASKGLFSKDSPFGKAILGHKVNDRVKIKVSENNSYFVKILSIKKFSQD